ncbi:MAG TPA: hypothetical protein VKV32_16260 [Stellaceae bacterium]|nr:hypothetical protein [Stellaceae bacterium]
MRTFLLLLALLPLAGCAPDASFKHPTTNATRACPAGILPDINPWSGYQLCMESAVSEGYQRVR